MENISITSIKLCIRRIRSSRNKVDCFRILKDIFSDISNKSGAAIQISEEIINYIETTDDNIEKLNPQKIAWVKEWAQMKVKENMPFVDRMILASTGETLREYIKRRSMGGTPVIDGMIRMPKVIPSPLVPILEDDNNKLFKVTDEIVTKIYNKCNDKQWDNITIGDFLILLNSDGGDKSLTIKKNEVNRTKCIFKAIANSIQDENRRDSWINGIKRNIFNGVDFMKATLRTNKLSSGYSETDVKFNPFLDSL